MANALMISVSRLKCSQVCCCGGGSIVTKNTVIPERSVMVGTPAKILEFVDDTTYSRLKKDSMDIYLLAKSHKGVLF